MHFVKMHGIGNDYVYVDVYSEPGLLAAADLAELARRVSDRHVGIGSDGLILVGRPDEDAKKAGAVVRMRMFNADGSEAEMCGNGVRCVAKFAHDKLGITARPMLVQTGRGVLSIDYTVVAGTPSAHGKSRAGTFELATVDMGEPILAAAQVPTAMAGDERGWVVERSMASGVLSEPWAREAGLRRGVTAVSMGNPHAVWFVEEAAKVPLETVGPRLETDTAFPKRVNVHFVQVHSRTSATMRTWERGAGITQACGTGACAVLVAGVLTGRLDRLATLKLPGGELTIRWDEASGHVLMTGPAAFVFEGEWLGYPAR